MQELGSGICAPRNGASDPSARPGEILSNPAVQRNFYDINQSIARPAKLAFDPKVAQALVEVKVHLLAQYVRHRNWAVWAQALVLFNVLGIPFSQGVYLEYYFNTALFRTSLSALSIIPALQVGVLLAMSIIIGWFYHWRGPRSGWRLLFCTAAVIAFAAQLSLQWIRSYMLTMILQGPLLGAALGTSFTLSTLVLSSHYRFNLSLVSMQSGFMGFLGAVVYTFIARQGLHTRGSGHYAPAASAGVHAGTLFIALLLFHRVEAVKIRPKLQRPQSGMKLRKIIGKVVAEQGTIWFILGYILVFFALFSFPMYITLILTQPPSQISPDTAVLVLLATFTTTSISASISANPFFRARLGPVDIFITSTVLAGAASLLPAWMPNVPIALSCGALYGVGLGAIAALHIKVSTVFHGETVVRRPEVSVRAAVMMVLAGCSAFIGTLVSAIVIETFESGVKVVSSGTSGFLILGGMLIGFARWKRCRRFNVAM
jgi:hypothetical protein